MIDPDYFPPRVPYASPLPQSVKPRLPGKPVQIMPPSPQRQGRRGYDFKSNQPAPWWEMFGPAFGTSMAMLLVMTVVCAVTWGLPNSTRVLAPMGASLFSAMGVLWWAKSRTVLIGPACGFATVMTLESAALPAALVCVNPDRCVMAPAFLGLLFVTMFGAMVGAIVASLLTREPCLERCHICK